MSDIQVFPEVGEMPERCRSYDWSATPLGPIDQWPASLLNAVSLVLRSGFPSILVWGRELVQVYNDAYIKLIGLKHPEALAISRELARGMGGDLSVRSILGAGSTFTLTLAARLS